MDRQRFSSLVLPWPVLALARFMVVGLLTVSGAYGFHGDEMITSWRASTLHSDTSTSRR